MKRWLPVSLGGVICCLLTFIPIAAQEQSVRPGINKPFENPDLEEFLKKFEGESREIAANAKQIVAACKLKPGMSVADVGAGTGLFTRKFAAEVGESGRVYAVDIAPTFLRHIKKTCEENKIKNVITIQCDQFSTRLPENSVDLVFICDTYHHFEFPERALQSIHEALRPGGQLILIDFHRIEGKSSDFVLGHVRAGQEVFVCEITLAGFQVIGEEKFLKENYFVRFEKRSESTLDRPQKKLERRPPVKVGLFEGSGDVGGVLYRGSVRFDPGKKSYMITGSGENMWGTTDSFHFLWTKLRGDVALAADVAFVGDGKEPHRKACLLVRQGLDPDAAYVDVAVHSDGLTSLQFRDAKGAATHEVRAAVSAPARVQLVVRGKYALLFAAAKGEELRFTGAAVRVAFDGAVLVGLGVCAHNKDVTETAVFSNVELTTTFPAPKKPPVLYSTLETQAMNSTDRRVVHVTSGRIEAPNWLRDGKTLIYNAGGRLYRIPAAGGTPAVIDTGFAVRCNNDHGVSPDGSRLVISDQSQGDRRSRIYTLPVAGGTPRLVTPNGPSYWHGWSPDGKTLAYCAERNGEYDVYTIPVDGGSETRLTTAKGLDDGPEYAPDGKHLYFNSERTGRMQIWRMNADGGEQIQITDDEFNNWFPHPSPDGRTLVFLSYEKNVTGHPADKDVTLRQMSFADKKIEVLGRFLGGQGTVNVPCWSPDGRRIAFVTYQLIP